MTGSVLLNFDVEGGSSDIETALDTIRVALQAGELSVSIDGTSYGADQVIVAVNPANYLTLLVKLHFWA